jgi:serine O-acetyltransferase
MPPIIKSAEDYRFFLKADEIALQINKKWPHCILAWLTNDIWQFQRILRKLEFYLNSKIFFSGNHIYYI